MVFCQLVRLITPVMDGLGGYHQTNFGFGSVMRYSADLPPLICFGQRSWLVAGWVIGLVASSGLLATCSKANLQHGSGRCWTRMTVGQLGPSDTYPSPGGLPEVQTETFDDGMAAASFAAETLTSTWTV